MRKKLQRQSGNLNSYLISFGDTMTALLAFFIVLNSLATDQTGVDLYAGTGSFIRATDEFGVPGIFKEKQSRQALQLQQPSPQYFVPADGEPELRGHGPDSESDTALVRDWEAENLERAINELARFHAPSHSHQAVREISFDRIKPLPTNGELLDEPLRELLRELVPSLKLPDSHVELIVWTPTPANAAWKRSTDLAAQLREAAAEYLQLDAANTGRLTSSSRLWIYSDIQRPALSVVVQKVD